MPLATAVPILSAGFLPLFDPGQASTEEAAGVWADAYLAYALNAVNATVIPARRNTLAADLTIAFDPESNGGGRSPFLLALAGFWLGTPGIPTGVVAIFIPSGSIDSNPGNDATPQQQADAIADLIHQLTVNSAKIIPVPPGPPIPVA
ncbi:hypothetical protein LCGC14_2944920 [marine sediment metagenome]|uniref:Uncharacterized protein n=1 Tax=marine sediment metagenome TaxID=412755 RepID=A0A0F9A828_9ZZZZ